MEINMPIKNAKRISSLYMQGNVLCMHFKTAKHILDIRGTSVFECPGNSLYLNPIQQA